MTETIVLTVPAERRFRVVVTMVLGGVGSRLDLPYERMDDLQLAVLSVLDSTGGEDVSVEFVADDERVTISLGPLVAGAGADDGLGRVLSRLVDSVQPMRRGDEEWVTLALARPRVAAG